MTSLSKKRPLSPHLAHYRWEITMVTSVLHRASGIVLALGLPILAIWITSVAAGGDYASRISAIINSWFGTLAMIGWTLALMFHLMNGLRHLGFDTGHGWGILTARATGWIAGLMAITLTVAIWLIVFFYKG